VPASAADAGVISLAEPEIMSGTSRSVKPAIRPMPAQ